VSQRADGWSEIKHKSRKPSMSELEHLKGLLGIKILLGVLGLDHFSSLQFSPPF
jgi:hypothetical protein